MNLAVAFIYAAGSLICHQRPERSFFGGAHQFPVCARCTGLYASAAAAFVIWWAIRWMRRAPPIAFTAPSALRAIAVAAVPTIVSWSTGVIGVWDGTNSIRALLAIPLGVTAGAVVAAVSTKDLR